MIRTGTKTRRIRRRRRGGGEAGRRNKKMMKKKEREGNGYVTVCNEPCCGPYAVSV
jgi:hypothetical protein